MVVDPGRRDIRVPQPLLNLGDVGLVIERVGRRCCPQRMHPDLKPQRLRIPPNNLVDRVRRDSLLRPFHSAVVGENRSEAYYR